MMTPQSAESFALWLMKDQPQLFIALAERAGVPVVKQLNGFADIFSAIGSGISTAAKSVGSFLTSSAGLTTLSTLGGVYLNTQAQKKAVQIQLEQAKAAQAAAPIETAYNPTTQAYEVLYTQQNGQRVPVTNQNVDYLLGSKAGSIFAASWFPYAAIGLVGVILFLFMRRK